MTMDPHENARGKQALDISIAFTGIAFIAVSMRLYTRFFIARCSGLEDYCIFLSFLSSVVTTVCIGYQVKWGLGEHYENIPEADKVKSLKAFWVSLMFYGLSLSFQKTSMLLLYLRVFTTRNFRIICWAMIGFVNVFGLWIVFSSVFACTPIRAFWTREPGSRCMDQIVLWFTNAGLNIMQDCIIILLPMPVIRNLNLGKPQKAALIGIFAIGGFVCVVSILRLPQLDAISDSLDPTYDNAPAATWSSIEVNVGIICACLPLLRPLLTRYFPGVFSSNKRSLNTAPRLYSTIGTSGRRRDSQSQNAIALDSKVRHPNNPVQENRDIQVVTDLHVSVEDSRDSVGGWRSNVSGRSINEELRQAGSTHSSTNTLVQDAGRAV